MSRFGLGGGGWGSDVGHGGMGQYEQFSHVQTNKQT